jgi:hypothetical protein
MRVCQFRHVRTPVQRVFPVPILRSPAPACQMREGAGCEGAPLAAEAPRAQAETEGQPVGQSPIVGEEPACAGHAGGLFRDAGLIRLGKRRKSGWGRVLGEDGQAPSSWAKL